MTYTPTYDNTPNSGTIVISYVDPVANKVNSIVYDNVRPDLLQKVNRLLRSNKS